MSKRPIFKTSLLWCFYLAQKLAKTLDQYHKIGQLSQYTLTAYSKYICVSPNAKQYTKVHNPQDTTCRLSSRSFVIRTSAFLSQP